MGSAWHSSPKRDRFCLTCSIWFSAKLCDSGSGSSMLLSIASCLQIPMIICSGAAFFSCAPSYFENQLALRPMRRGFQSFSSFNAVLTKPAATGYSIAFLFQLFLGLLPSMFPSSVLQICDVVMVPISWVATALLTNEPPFKTERIMQNRPFQMIKSPLG